MPKRKLTSEDKITCAIDVMETLAPAADNGMDVDDLCHRFDIDSVALDEIIETISSLADRESGARPICYRKDGRVYLMGDAGRMLPLRLTAAEGAVLNHELEMLDMDHEAAVRIRRALLPAELGYTPRVSGGAEHGPFWQTLACAIEDGVRCRIRYRSLTDDAATVRTIDPLHMTTRGGCAYVIAWDIDRDGARSYRLDKIEDVELTDDSVVTHAQAPRTIDEALANISRVARLRMPAARAEQLSWAGIEHIEHKADEAIVTVRYGSEQWLFCQVLAEGGTTTIVDDPALSKRLEAFASTLVL